MTQLRWGAACGALLVLAACGRGDERPVGVPEEAEEAVEALAPVGTLPQGITAEEGTSGRELYARTCVVCHGEQGQGTQLGPALAGLQRTFEEITAVVRDGVAEPDSFPVPMHPRGDGTLDDAQVRAVAAYVYSLAR